MEAVTPFLTDAAVLLPWFAWLAWRAKPPSFSWSLVALLVAVPLFCGGLLTKNALLLSLCGTPAVWTARRCEMPRRICGPLTLAAAGLFIVGDALHFRYRDYLPWVAAVREAQEQYPPIPRSTVLPEPASAIVQDTPHPPPNTWNEAFPVTDRIPWRPQGEGESHRFALSRLHGLHEEFRYRFATRLGFGPIRMPRSHFNPLPLLREEDRIPVFSQPREGEMWEDDWLTTEPPPPEATAEQLAAWHSERGIDFANAAGFGVLARGDEDQDNVALPADIDPADAPFLIGFRPHAAQTPADQPLAPAWRLERIELIGFLLHDEPTAYASESLPRMGETATHVTRPLTTFEQAALPKLAAGEWVVAAADRYRLRAVGALPAAKACATCHAVEEGTLLGALSYDFIRDAAALSGM